MVDSVSRTSASVVNGSIRTDRLVRSMREAGMSATQIEEVLAGTETRPEDLITLQEANDRHGVPRGTLLGWIHVGHLPVKGRIPYPARGGGKVLVDETDVVYLKQHPPKRGRPSKNGP